MKNFQTSSCTHPSPFESRLPEDTPCVLVVDDESGVIRAVSRLLSGSRFHLLTAHRPVDAISILHGQEIAVVISDHLMPGMTGLELLSLVRQRWPATVGIMMTSCNDIQIAADAVNRHLINYFVAKPWDSRTFRSLVDEAVELYRQRCKHPYNRLPGDDTLLRYLRENSGKAAFSLARAVDARDTYTHCHSENVAAFAQVVGRTMGFSEGALEELRIGGLLHDVGKIGVADGVLKKPGKLTDEEYDAMKLHTAVGGSIVDPIDFPWNIPAIVRQHHENHDGTGYPDGIAGEEITLAARVIHVVDAYEAMAADRVYRTARSRDWIEKEFLRCRGTQFDPEVTYVFLQELEQGNIAYPTPQKLTRTRCPLR
jgi:putative nucleotidyltransferase with HDIG domain